jgi:tetratricopeptide (TPR) repeat protein
MILSSLAEAAVLRNQGRFEEALSLLREAVRLRPSDPVPHALMGEIFRELGARLRGYASIQDALRLDSDGKAAREHARAASKENAWAFALLGGLARAAGNTAEATKHLEEALSLDSSCGWAWGWLGEVHLREGRLAQAREALDRSISLFAEWAEAFAWRGETHRLSGAVNEALRDLDHAVALGHRQYDVFLSRAAARAAAGDVAGQAADQERALRQAPELFRSRAREVKDAVATKAIERLLTKMARAKALLERGRKDAAAGKTESALRQLNDSLSVDSQAVEALLLRSQLHERGGRLQDSLKDADAAVKLDPSSETYARRADIAQKTGHMEAALRDLSLSLGMAPKAELLRWRAQTFLGMRHYDLAIKDVSAALELTPEDPALYDLRANVSLMLGRQNEAQRDIERALTLLPNDVNLHLRRGQLLCLQGRFEEARASVSPIERRFPAWASFIRGYVLCVEKRYAQATREFERAETLAGEKDGNLARQTKFYGTVAKAFAATMPTEKGMARKKEAKNKGKVYLCGLGVYPPQTATVEVLRAISECDVIFNNLPGAGISEFLGLFCANRRPVAFRYEQDAQLCADLVLSELGAGRTVGFVTFGHPLLFGPLSHEIIKRCAKESIPCKAFGAVSSMDAVLAASGQVLGYSYGGFQLFETTGMSILGEISAGNPRLPMVIYFADGMGEEWLGKLAKTLAKIHSSSHRCLFYGPRHELWEQQQESFTVAELAKSSHHKLAQGILFVPPR